MPCSTLKKKTDKNTETQITDPELFEQKVSTIPIKLTSMD